MKEISKRVALSAMLIALAMIFSYVEVLIPFNFGIPGIKLGLANLIVLTGLYYLPLRQVALVSFLRILLSGLLFGNPYSIIYSLAGGVLSLVVMALLKQVKALSIMGVSIAGGVAHNVAQLLVASIIVRSGVVFAYLPVLLIAGSICGLILGIVAGNLPKRILERKGD